uniref:Ovule protein n=1 Tax=Ascaris lumbricoides TaxID=6252 RepID=A0A0M3I009_ASCLU
MRVCEALMKKKQYYFTYDLRLFYSVSVWEAAKRRTVKGPKRWSCMNGSVGLYPFAGALLHGSVIVQRFSLSRIGHHCDVNLIQSHLSSSHWCNKFC